MSGAAPKLLYLVTEDWYFWSHRLPMARAALAAGFRVGVATRVDAHGERIRAEGFALHPLGWRRHAGPIAALRAVCEIARLYRRERPAIVHHVALKATILGAAAAALAGVPAVVGSINGMGYAFSSDRLTARLVRSPIRFALRRILGSLRHHMIVQNPEDRHMLLGLLPAASERVTIIPGSGVDVVHFRPLAEPPPEPLTIAVAGRMVQSKGIATVVEAQQRLRARGIAVRLLLAGVPDTENPASYQRAQLERWAALSGVEWLGHVEDIREVWARAHVAVQASAGDGLPKSLLEACACARPIVASDTPGCRAIAREGVNALLFPLGDAEALADAIQRLGRNEALRRRFGEAGRALVEADLSDVRIGADTAALYRRLLSSRPGEASVVAAR